MCVCVCMHVCANSHRVCMCTHVHTCAFVCICQQAHIMHVMHTWCLLCRHSHTRGVLRTSVHTSPYHACYAHGACSACIAKPVEFCSQAYTQAHMPHKKRPIWGISTSKKRANQSSAKLDFMKASAILARPQCLYSGLGPCSMQGAQARDACRRSHNISLAQIVTKPKPGQSLGAHSWFII